MAEEEVIIGIGILALAGFLLYYFYEKELKGKQQAQVSYQYTTQTPITGEEYGRYVERVYPIPQSTVAVSQAYIYSEPTQ